MTELVFVTLDKLDEYDCRQCLQSGRAGSDSVIEKRHKSRCFAYTYGTNEMEVGTSGENLPFMVNYIDREQIRRDVLLARKQEQRC